MELLSLDELLQGLVAASLSLLPIALYLMGVGLVKAFVEPLSHQLAISAFRKFIQPAWDKMDEELILPGGFEKWATQGKTWVYRAVLPEEAKEKLTPNEIAAFLDYLESNFEIKSLRKKKGKAND